MILKTPSLVIRTTQYSETSLIVSLYTLEEGKVRCIAKGARRSKSPLGGKLEPLNELEVVYLRGRSELCTLNECSIIRSRMAIRQNLERLNAALLILFLIEQTQADRDPNADVFHLAVTCLDEMEKKSNPEMILLYFQTRLLEASGYAPDYTQCAICSLEIGKKSVYYPARNGFLCSSCSGKHRGITITAGTMEILRKIQKADIKNALRMRLSVAQNKESRKILSATFESVLEHKSEAGRFFDEMGKP
jgi:DNA repair protein RecO (recombination protein O)